MTKLSSSPGRLLGVLAVVIALCGTTFAVTYAATADKAAKKITVCVKKSGGTLYSAKKCARGDKKLSWNKAGVAGPAGADGAVAGYSATQTGSLVINNNHNVQNTVLTKNLPAGSYVINSTLVMAASDDTNDSFASVECRLTAGSSFNSSKWNERLGGIVILWAATNTLSNTLAYTSTNPFTVTLSCADLHTADQANFTETVTNAAITAVQTSGNS
jgi:hypothetical protein